MKNEETKVDQLIDHVEEYIKTRQELTKMVVAEKSSIIVSSLVSNLVIVFIFFFVFVFASIALAYGISEMMGQAYAGFLAVAMLYFIIGLVLYANRGRWLKMPISNAVIKIFFKKNGHESN